MKIAPREPYSYRGDPAVPGFDDRGPAIRISGDRMFRIRPAPDWPCRIARNRYRVTGRTDMCAIPDASLKSRLLT
jgi:hypothetical protein